MSTFQPSRRRARMVPAAALTAIVCLLTVALPTRTAYAQNATPKGTLLIVGGGPQPPALVKQFVDLAGGTGKARIVVFAEASADGAKSGEEKADDLRKLGAQAENIWVTHDQANTDSVAHLLDHATGVWFVGGDQVVLNKVLRGTKTEAAIHTRYMAGAVIGGTSAGAAVMSEVMLTGDERHPGGDRRDTTEAFMTIARGNVVTDTGFALIRTAIIDQHFLRRKRHNRLMSLVLEREPHLGVGIDESTAILVHPNGTWTVAGASVAVIYDARHSKITLPQSHVLGATDLRVHVLPAGATFNP
ncbi:MAG: cyanophycinase, partial [Gemmatimonadaceae bacterium]